MTSRVVPKQDRQRVFLLRDLQLDLRNGRERGLVFRLALRQFHLRHFAARKAQLKHIDGSRTARDRGLRNIELPVERQQVHIRRRHRCHQRQDRRTPALFAREQVRTGSFRLPAQLAEEIDLPGRRERRLVLVQDRADARRQLRAKRHTLALRVEPRGRLREQLRARGHRTARETARREPPRSSRPCCRRARWRSARSTPDPETVPTTLC